jgi:putative Mg2+ transporter-C (MgtC) family protein
MMPETDHVIRIAVAMVLGGLVGIERELNDKPAGFRTIILICVGACIFTIISAVMGGRDEQSTRIAAQVVTGIGFLGAGAILRNRKAVFGLTTAATIWSVAAIGMAAGFGQLGLAAFGTGVILVALWLFDAVEHWIGDARDLQDFHIAGANQDDTFDRISKMFADSSLRIRKRSCYEENELLVVHIVAMGSKQNHDILRRSIIRSSEWTLRRA